MLWLLVGATLVIWGAFAVIATASVAKDLFLALEETSPLPNSQDMPHANNRLNETGGL